MSCLIITSESVPCASAELVTDIREVAETVRTYGRRGERSIAVDAPRSLHVIAAQLESELRRWAHTEHSVARMFGERRGAASIRLTGLREVLSQVTPEPKSAEVQEAELRAAAARLSVVAQDLAAAMVTRSASQFVAVLHLQSAKIEKFAECSRRDLTTRRRTSC